MNMKTYLSTYYRDYKVIYAKIIQFYGIKYAEASFVFKEESLKTLNLDKANLWIPRNQMNFYPSKKIPKGRQTKGRVKSVNLEELSKEFNEEILIESKKILQEVEQEVETHTSNYATVDAKEIIDDVMKDSEERLEESIQEFNRVNESCSTRLEEEKIDYRTIWKNGPTYYHNKNSESEWIRKSFEKVTLRFLYDIQNITDEFVNKVESYMRRPKRLTSACGISQNPDTKVYILVFSDFFHGSSYLDDYCEKCGNLYRDKCCRIDQLKNNFTNWTSENIKLVDFIQRLQLEINSYDQIFEWISHNELVYIKPTGDNCLTMAIWKDGPLHYDKCEKKYIRNSAYKKVGLRFLYDLRNINDEFLNKVESYSFYNGFWAYGISQDPDTKVYILVFDISYLNYYCEKCGNKYEVKYKYDIKWCKQCRIDQLKNNFANWTSGNVKLDEFIQKMQLKISDYNDMIFEWILYNEFIEIKRMNVEDELAIAIWKDGPLIYTNKRIITKESYKKVVLKYLYNLQEITDEFLNKVESYLESGKIYGISQNPVTKVYILVFNERYFDQYCEKCGNKYEDSYKNDIKWCKQCQIDRFQSNFTNWTSGNVKLDEFIQKMQLQISSYDMIFEWIPYNEFTEIKGMNVEDELDEFATAIWKNGPLIYTNKRILTEELYSKVVLKYLYNLQDITDEFLNKVESYINDIRNIYGLSQDPDTKVYILVFSNECFLKYCLKCLKCYENYYFSYLEAVYFVKQNMKIKKLGI
ncbi:kinase-like domain-containing protein [Rhizophagus clarus]|uniref:Kinase-like domain-containing protein n=1 Tax=Rhizophagus clarus TaxID=94130 RepID=A0A8H3LJW2_9GLOM|nr:kinase-like domain-containing protein [Rhizophagus clarus]